MSLLLIYCFISAKASCFDLSEITCSNKIKPSIDFSKNNILITKMDSNDWIMNIRFVSKNKGSKIKSIEFINEAIEKDSALLKSQQLTGGLKAWTEDFIITIADEDTFYSVDLGPKSGEGHDFSFRVDKITQKISNFIVGEVEPEPED